MSSNTTTETARTWGEFEGWRAQVDAEVSRRIGVGLDDLPDCPTADWFEEGMTVKQAARAAIAAASDELD